MKGTIVLQVRTGIHQQRRDWSWRGYLALKRAVDVLLSLMALLCLSPLFPLLAWLIRRDSPGPAIFRQERIGQHGRPFVMYKFRTMYVEAPKYAYKPRDGNDPRITPLGRFLRRTSLDEIPQFFNVLKGEMSLVGPRPEQPFIVEAYEPWQQRRLLVKPGLTGWWQINGRSDKPMHQHVEYDLYYVDHQSLLLDLKILFKTIPVVLSRAGAH